MGEPVFIICWRVVDMTGRAVAGSRHARCQQCRAKVWLSAATERAVAKRGQPSEIRCQRCVPAPPGGAPWETVVPREVIDEAIQESGDPEGIGRVVELLTGRRPNDG